MTPLQKGMLKEYKKEVCKCTVIAVVYFFLSKLDIDFIKYFLLAPIIGPFLAVYVYYMENKIKEENEKTSIRKDMLQIFIVCFLFSTIVFAILMYKYWKWWVNWYFYIFYCILIPIVAPFVYYNHLKKKKKKEQERKENPPS